MRQRDPIALSVPDRPWRLRHLQHGARQLGTGLPPSRAVLGLGGHRSAGGLVGGQRVHRGHVGGRPATYGHGPVRWAKQLHEVRGLSDEATSIVRPTSLMRFRFCGREAEEDGLPAVKWESARAEMGQQRQSDQPEAAEAAFRGGSPIAVARARQGQTNFSCCRLRQSSAAASWR
jgi:hypothetical protein